MRVLWLHAQTQSKDLTGDWGFAWAPFCQVHRRDLKELRRELLVSGAGRFHTTPVRSVDCGVAFLPVLDLHDLQFLWGFLVDFGAPMCNCNRHLPTGFFDFHDFLNRQIPCGFCVSERVSRFQIWADLQAVYSAKCVFVVINICIVRVL